MGGVRSAKPCTLTTGLKCSYLARQGGYNEAGRSNAEGERAKAWPLGRRAARKMAGGGPRWRSGAGSRKPQRVRTRTARYRGYSGRCAAAIASRFLLPPAWDPARSVPERVFPAGRPSPGGSGASGRCPCWLSGVNRHPIRMGAGGVLLPGRLPSCRWRMCPTCSAWLSCAGRRGRLRRKRPSF